jgi:hypothetical protein
MSDNPEVNLEEFATPLGINASACCIPKKKDGVTPALHKADISSPDDEQSLILCDHPSEAKAENLKLS